MKRENFSAFCWTLAFALQSSNFFHRPVYCVNNTFYKIPYNHKKNLNVARPSRKLNLRFAGIDNSFPVSLLQPAATDPFPNQTTTTLPVVDANTRY